MDPMAQFNMDATRKLFEEKTKEGKARVERITAHYEMIRSERRRINADIDAGLPPVSELLTASELQEILDFNARWIVERGERERERG